MRDEPWSPRAAPAVTITGGPAGGGADVVDGEPPVSSRGPWLLGLAAGTVLLGGLVLGGGGASPPAAEPLDVTLRLLDAELSNSQSGVIVLPVEVVVRGPGFTVERAVAWAEPVRQAAATTGQTRFRADSTGRVLVLVQPDCRLLSPAQDTAVAATLQLELTGAGDQRATAVLDLGAEPALAARVSAVCAPGDPSIVLP